MSFFIAPLIMLPSFLTVVLVAILFADIEMVLAVRCPDRRKLYFHIHIKRKQQLYTSFKKLTTNHICFMVTGLFAAKFFAAGYFAARIFAARIFAAKNFCRKDFSPQEFFTARNFRRKELSPQGILAAVMFRRMTFSP